MFACLAWIDYRPLAYLPVTWAMTQRLVGLVADTLTVRYYDGSALTWKAAATIYDDHGIILGWEITTPGL